jgi:hypothetical protein
LRKRLITLATLQAIAGCLACVGIWYFLYWTKSERLVAVVTITDDDGTAHTVTLSQADPVVPSLFDSGPSIDVIRYGNKTVTLRRGLFDLDVSCDVLVSPDRSEVLICRPGEGGWYAILRIHLNTGQMTHLDMYHSLFTDSGWTRQPWQKLGASAVPPGDANQALPQQAPD